MIQSKAKIVSMHCGTVIGLIVILIILIIIIILMF